MKLAIEGFFSKCDEAHRKLRIWSHVLKKSLMGNFTFCAVLLQNATAILLLNATKVY